MISVLYIVLSALLIAKLSMMVIKLRRKHHVSVGDGGHADLINAISAQSNAIEYIPITLLLLAGLEFNSANLVLVHLGGIALLAGRLIHARGMHTDKLKTRVIGMQITFYTIITLAVLNMIYLPYTKLLSF